MLLYVMRHGPAEDRAPTGRDFDRALTPAGREVVARTARALDEARQLLGGRPLRALASPFRRARETAEIVAAALTPALEVGLHEDLGADAGTPIRLARELSAAGTDALLIGHQPFVEELVRDLVRAGDGGPSKGPPGLLAKGFRTALLITLSRGPDPGGRWQPGEVFDPHA